MGFSVSRMVTSLALVAIIDVEAASANEARCPCKYKPAGFKYATSAYPISPAHVACMKFIEQHLRFLNIKSENARLQSTLLHGQSRGAAYDYGVPPADDAEAAAAAATAQAAADQIEQEKPKEALDRSIEDLAKARIDLKRLKSYGLGKEIDQNNRGMRESLVKMSEIIVAKKQEVAVLDDVTLRITRAAWAFSNCVAHNKLPPTTDMSAIKSMVDMDKYLPEQDTPKTADGGVSDETSPMENSNKPKVTWDDVLGISTPTASSATAPSTNATEPDDAYKLYARAEVTGQIAERVCPGAKVNGEKLKEFRRANVRNEDQLATELELRRVSTESEVERVGAEQWCGWSKNQFGSEGLDYAGLIEFP
jgi:hypothetical protein